MAISTLGKRVLLKRRDLGLTQAQLGEACNLTANTIARLERGLVQDLRAGAVAKIAVRLGTSMDYLMGLTGENGTQPRSPARGNR